MGGGFVKSRPGREASQDDYLELLRVAEVLDALNQVRLRRLSNFHRQQLLAGFICVRIILLIHAGGCCAF
eukprot:SAG11_NODE_1861_length_4155_cov_8.828156_2_plen_70_part_00